MVAGDGTWWQSIARSMREALSSISRTTKKKKRDYVRILASQKSTNATNAFSFLS
jgi:hypothetical protein